MSVAAAVAAWPRLGDVQGTARFYWEVARRGYARFATYRGATIAGVFTNTVFGFLRAYVLIALFTSRPHVGGYTLSDALTYTWLTQGALMVIYIWGWYEIAERIRSGDIISDFQRPIDFQFYWLSQDLGRALYHAIYRGVPPFVLGAIAFRLVFPHNPGTYALFVVSLFLSVCLSFALRFIFNVLAFWLMDYRGINGLAAVFWTFLSGFIIPLAVFPSTWRTVAELLPFAGMIQTPIDIYLQKSQGLGLLGALGLQIFWTAVLLAAGRRLLARAMTKLEVQGG
jgi:ABC-2 type transport system permease protein